MKTSGLRNVILKAILLILFCLYFLLVFSKTLSASVTLPDQNFSGSLSSKQGSLPKLLSFEGLSSNRQVKLNWKFETTEGLDECIVERADKSGNFKPVAYFFMTEDIHIPNLHYTDNVPKNNTYYYRLQLTGKDGDKQYTKTLSFNVGSEDQKQSLSYPAVLE
jgi:hypothetical protein